MHDGDGFDQLYKVYVSHVPTVTYVYRGDHLGTYVWMYVLRMICTNARMHVPGTRYILGMRDEYRLLWPLRPHCLALRRTFLKTLAKTSRRSFKITILRVPRTTLDLLQFRRIPYTSSNNNNNNNNSGVGVLVEAGFGRGELGA